MWGGSLKNHPLAVCRRCRRRVGNNPEQWSIFLGTEVASSDSPLTPLSSTPLRNYCELLMWPIEALAARWQNRPSRPRRGQLTLSSGPYSCQSVNLARRKKSFQIRVTDVSSQPFRGLRWFRWMNLWMPETARCDPGTHRRVPSVGNLRCFSLLQLRSTKHLVSSFVGLKYLKLEPTIKISASKLRFSALWWYARTHLLDTDRRSNEKVVERADATTLA